MFSGCAPCVEGLRMVTRRQEAASTVSYIMGVRIYDYCGFRESERGGGKDGKSAENGAMVAYNPSSFLLTIESRSLVSRLLR